jgi:hypothetical protein
MSRTVFRDVAVEWDGRTYTVTPTNRLMRRIESQGVSLLDLVVRCGGPRPPLSELAFVAAELLRSAGATVDEDAVAAAMWAELHQGKRAVFDALGDMVATCVTPTVEVAEGNGDARP